VIAGAPVGNPPRLYDTLVGNKLHVPPQDVTATERKSADCITADFRGDIRSHGLAIRTEQHNLMKLFWISKRFIHTFPARS
jgi:hypothetical protein